MPHGFVAFQDFPVLPLVLGWVETLFASMFYGKNIDQGQAVRHWQCLPGLSWSL